MSNNFKQLHTIGLEQVILSLFKEASNNKIRASLSIISDLLNQRGTNTTKDKVRHAIDNLIQDGKIARKEDVQGGYLTVLDNIDDLLTTHREKRNVRTPATPVVYKMYDYMKDFYHNGYFVSMADLAKYLNISEREVRRIKKGINKGLYELKNGRTFKRKILGNNKGYTLVSNEQQRKEARWIILNKFYDALDELRVFDDSTNNHDQLYFDMRTAEINITKSISDDLEREEEHEKI